MKRHLVIIPACNEARHIESVLRQVLQCCGNACDVLVVDDASADETPAIAERCGALVIRHEKNRGYGQALQTAYRYADEKGYQIFAQMDGDGQHDARYLEPLFDILRKDQADAVIGNRFMDASLGGTYHAGIIRRTGMLFFAALVTLAVRRKITDPTSGFRAFHRCVLPILRHSDYPPDYPDADAIIMLARYGARICETAVPMYTKDERKSMHSGWRPLLYAFHMTFSVMKTAITPYKNATMQGRREGKSFKGRV